MFTRVFLTRDILEDSHDIVLQRVPALEERVHTNHEDGHEEPQDTNDDPAGEEFLAENVARAVHGHGPEDQECESENDGHCFGDEGGFEEFLLLFFGGGFGDGCHAGDEFDVFFGNHVRVVAFADGAHGLPVVFGWEVLAVRRVRRWTHDLPTPKMRVKIGMKISGESKATTLPANMGLLAPVHVTESSPHSFLAVTSHAMSEQTKPRGGLKVAACQLKPDHMSVKVAGTTAEEIMTPIMR